MHETKSYMNSKEKIIIGTAQFGLNYGILNNLGKPTTEQVLELMSSLYHSGFNQLDSSEGYGNAHELISLSRSLKIKFNIFTKILPTTNPNDLEEKFEEIEDLLGKDTVKCLSLHGFLVDSIPYLLIKKIQYLKEQKKIQSIGISLYTKEEMKKALNYKELDIVQIPFNILDSDDEKIEIIKALREKGKKIHARSIFLQGLLANNKLPTTLMELQPYLNTVDNISAKNGLSRRQLSFNYVFNSPLIDNTIIGIENETQLNDLKSLIFNSNHSISTNIPSDIFKRPPSNLIDPRNWAK